MVTEVNHANHAYDVYGENSAEKVKAVQAEETEEEKAAEKTGSGKEAEPARRDEYISSEGKKEETSGVYQVEQDEDGCRKIKFNDPEKEEDSQCSVNTDKVDREIKRLKEEKQQLEQQLQAASGDERKTEELERKIKAVEEELSRKDNDTYRRQHAVFS